MSDINRPLDTVLADWREDAAALRRLGDNRTAEIVERICDECAEAAEDYLTWLREDQALLRSGHTVEWLRTRFAEWERQGHARLGRTRKREYRQVVIPQRADPDGAREAGRQAGAAA